MRLSSLHPSLPPSLPPCLAPSLSFPPPIPLHLSLRLTAPLLDPSCVDRRRSWLAASHPGRLGAPLRARAARSQGGQLTSGRLNPRSPKEAPKEPQRSPAARSLASYLMRAPAFHVVVWAGLALDPLRLGLLRPADPPLRRYRAVLLVQDLRRRRRRLGRAEACARDGLVRRKPGRVLRHAGRR